MIESGRERDAVSRGAPWDEQDQAWLDQRLAGPGRRKRERRAGSGGRPGRSGRPAGTRLSFYPDGQVYLPTTAFKALGEAEAVVLHPVSDGTRALDALVMVGVREGSSQRAIAVVRASARGSAKLRLRVWERRVLASPGLARVPWRALVLPGPLGQRVLLLDLDGLRQRRAEVESLLASDATWRGLWRESRLGPSLDVGAIEVAL